MSADDHRLIDACLKGQTAAFGELVARYQDRLYHSVFRLVENPEDARDVVQDAFVNAYSSLASFKAESQFFTWLYRIAINTAISFKRKQKANLKLFRGAGEEQADASTDVQPSRGLEMAEQEKRVHEALAKLSPEYRAVLVMKDMDDMKYEQMAEILGVPIGTIRSRLHRARLELREILLRDQ